MLQSVHCSDEMRYKSLIHFTYFAIPAFVGYDKKM